MQFNTFFVCLVLSCLCLSLAQEDCCLKYVTKVSHSMKKHAVKYRIQPLDGGCNIHAIIFVMRRGRRVCADPAAVESIKLKAMIDRKDKQGHNKTG